MNDVTTLTTVGLYAGISAGLVLLALVAIIVPILLRRRGAKPTQSVSRHSAARTPGKWRGAVEQVRTDYHQGRLGEADAYAQLASIARGFASQRLGTDLTSKTLLDLNLHHQVGNKKYFDTLKQTISALYPAEFADEASNRAAAESSVDSAATWVDTMIERWAR